MSTHAKCTLCAKVESPGFYTGCMIAEGHCKNSGWTCDADSAGVLVWNANAAEQIEAAITAIHKQDGNRKE